MTSKFLKRNKDKSVLAALLLLLRQRKILTLLLVAVLLTSGLLAAPSSLIISLPGGTRAAAGIAWLAQKAGLDVSRWGLGSDRRRSFGDLLAAFQAAKERSSSLPGWSAFFAGNGVLGGAAGSAGQGSLDFVRGSKSDLIAGGGAAAGGKGASPTGFAGAVDPADARNDRNAGVVQLDAGDVGGRREGWMKSAFAGGFLKGLFGGGAGGAGGASGSGDAGALSGGAYAGKGFFNGGGGAASADSKWDALLQNGLAGTGTTAVPKGRIIAGTASRVSAMRARAAASRAMSGAAMAASLNNGHSAYVQLAAGSGFAKYADTPGRADENAAVGNSIVFDGGTPSDSILAGASGNTGDAPGLGGVDSIDGAIATAQKQQNCMTAQTQCDSDKHPYMVAIGQDQAQINNWVSQLPGACSDSCNCGHCNELTTNIVNLCHGDLQTSINKVQAACNMPSYCSSLGFDGASPAAQQAGAAQSMCSFNSGACGCGGGLGGALCGLMCALGS